MKNIALFEFMKFRYKLNCLKFNYKLNCLKFNLVYIQSKKKAVAIEIL